jgi:hypothetical protein
LHVFGYAERLAFMADHPRLELSRDAEFLAHRPNEAVQVPIGEVLPEFIWVGGIPLSIGTVSRRGLFVSAKDAPEPFPQTHALHLVEEVSVKGQSFQYELRLVLPLPSPLLLLSRQKEVK